MDTRKILRLAFVSSLVLGVASTLDTAAGQSKIESPCDKNGPFSPRIDKDLSRKDLVVEPVELPRVRVVPRRTPEQERNADRAACQDAQTGKTIIMPDLPRGSRKRVYPGGDEGDPSLPRGDKRRADNGPPYLIKVFVFGNEDRVRQTPTTPFPFRAVVKLLVKFPNTLPGTATGCTGSLIGGKHVLTAGHCVFQSGKGGWATSIKVIPGFDTIPPFDKDEIEPFGDASMVKRWSSTGWVNDGNWPDDDWGLITLNKTFNVGSFGLIFPSDSFLDSTSACIIGYPGGLGNKKGDQQYFVPGCGTIWAHSSKHVELKMDITNGNSGGGIYTFFKGKRAIFAIVSTEVSPVVGSDYNAGTRITKARHDVFRALQCKDGVTSAC